MEGRDDITPWVAERANYKGNYAELCYERWTTKESVNKLAELYYDHLTTVTKEDARYVMNSTPFVQGDYVECAEDLLDMLKDKSRDYCVNWFSGILRSIIEKVFNHTRIDDAVIGGMGSPADVGTVSRLDPIVGEKATVQQVSMIEAHEKGHGIRYFKGKSAVTEYIRSGFDFESVKIDKKLIRVLIEKSDFPSEVLARKGFFGRNSVAQAEYEWTAIELLERMSQLKNYFGMSVGEEFTLDHLEYAREHFSKDLGGSYEVQMTSFFSMITTETQKRFIELMNDLPV